MNEISIKQKLRKQLLVKWREWNYSKSWSFIKQ